MKWFTNTEDTRELPDEEILLRSQNEPWLFAVLLDRYQDAFLRKAVGIIREPRDAEEIVQDTFTKIYVHAGSFAPQEGAKFSSWAYRILMNTAFTYYQKRVKAGNRFTTLDPEFEQFVADKTSSLASYVLRLHYIERWSQEDIAAETGEAVGTIKARIHRAKAAFRREARTEEVEIIL
jgi:RNA polymerase sigma-70 factor, ECF subfamily